MQKICRVFLRENGCWSVFPQTKNNTNNFLKNPSKTHKVNSLGIAHQNPDIVGIAHPTILRYCMATPRKLSEII
jgi:hypothetical protein